jgi:hypothetical protein
MWIYERAYTSPRCSHNCAIVKIDDESIGGANDHPRRFLTWCNVAEIAGDFENALTTGARL